jgi:hypothetical protein
MVPDTINFSSFWDILRQTHKPAVGDSVSRKFKVRSLQVKGFVRHSMSLVMKSIDEKD